MPAVDRCETDVIHPAHLLFEEDGAFKAGTALSATDSAFQVELPTGRRTKVKSSHVLLRFDQPAPAQLVERAQALAAEIDLDFLWECAPQEEFGFAELAAEYHGRAPSAIESAALLYRLHGAPVYFHRKGRGRYRPAPPETLRAALAALERKRRQDELRQEFTAALKAGTAPPQIVAAGIDLVIRPDRNSVEVKAVEQAAAELHTSPLRLLIACGAIASPYHWHVASFQRASFPRGTGFPAGLPAPDPAAGADLPLSTVAAFSIDDSTTTEIDDAFSVVALPGDGRVRVGIHIAAPAAVIARDHPLDAVARARMSTVYAPGLKYTMLPEEWIEAYSLNEGRVVPVVTLNLEVDATTLEVLSFDTAVERVRISANLRHDQLDERVTAERLDAAALDDVPHGGDLVFLWGLARSLLRAREAVRGRPEPIGRIDYGFALEGEGEAARVAIKARRRGAPLDLIVAELMILANSHWGGWLAERRRVAIYRSQGRIDGITRVKMGTVPAPHDGIGVPQYAWSTSPLRRYVDLVNQRQLIAAVRGDPPPYGHQDAELYAVVSGFDAAYAAYGEFQSRLERYWCLRWLEQEQVERLDATVVRGDVIRVEGLPLVTRVPGLPELPRGRRLRFQVLARDPVELSVELRLLAVLDEESAGEEIASLAEEELEGGLLSPGLAPVPSGGPEASTEGRETRAEGGEEDADAAAGGNPVDAVDEGPPRAGGHRPAATAADARDAGPAGGTGNHA